MYWNRPVGYHLSYKVGFSPFGLFRIQAVVQWRLQAWHHLCCQFPSLLPSEIPSESPSRTPSLAFTTSITLNKAVTALSHLRIVIPASYAVNCNTTNNMSENLKAYRWLHYMGGKDDIQEIRLCNNYTSSLLKGFELTIQGSAKTNTVHHIASTSLFNSEGTTSERLDYLTYSNYNFWEYTTDNTSGSWQWWWQ